MTSSQQQHYDECIANGCAPRLAEMLALRQFPYSRTDREFLAGHCNGSQFEGKEELGNRFRKAAKKAGVNTAGKVYLHQLAASPCDPKAWVSDRSDVKRVLKERGWSADGMVQHKEPLRDPTPDIPIAADIVETYTQKEMAKDPGQNRKKVREDVINKHTPYWAK